MGVSSQYPWVPGLVKVILSDHIGLPFDDFLDWSLWHPRKVVDVFSGRWKIPSPKSQHSVIDNLRWFPFVLIIMFLVLLYVLWLVFPVNQRKTWKRERSWWACNWICQVFVGKKKLPGSSCNFLCPLSRAQPFQGLLLFEVAHGGGEEPRMVVGGGYHQKHQHLYTWTFLSGVSTGCKGVGIKQPFRVSTPPVGGCWKW